MRLYTMIQKSAGLADSEGKWLRGIGTGLGTFLLSRLFGAKTSTAAILSAIAGTGAYNTHNIAKLFQPKQDPTSPDKTQPQPPAPAPTKEQRAAGEQFSQAARLKNPVPLILRNQDPLVKYREKPAPNSPGETQSQPAVTAPAPAASTIPPAKPAVSAPAAQRPAPQQKPSPVTDQQRQILREVIKRSIRYRLKPLAPTSPDQSLLKQT